MNQTVRKTSWGNRITRLILTDRSILIIVLTLVVLVVFYFLGQQGRLFASFDGYYLGSALVSMVPLCLLALAEMFAIMSGRGGIDLSVGSIVSLSGILFGAMLNFWNLPLIVAMCITIIFGALLGLVNGFLIGYLKFPAFIATLATSYIYGSLALFSTGNAPISGGRVAETFTLTNLIDLGWTTIPTHVFTIMLPCVILCWVILSKSRWGRSLYAVGTNDIAARYNTQPVALTRMSAFVLSGFLSGVAAVVNVAQFASARPDAGSAGSGMALPAIVIAVLGGVAIQGGLGKISGTVLAALLVTWLNAAILISFEGSMGPRFQLAALGTLLLAAVILNTFSAKRLGVNT
ncbi:MAG: ABC transporter permease [Actinomycetaceae bacterium]|nr:ABC transporter permease [Actinomycetaceae bacterium]